MSRAHRRNMADDECGCPTDADRAAALWWATTTAVAAFVDYRQPTDAD